MMVAISVLHSAADKHGPVPSVIWRSFLG